MKTGIHLDTRCDLSAQTEQQIDEVAEWHAEISNRCRVMSHRYQCRMYINPAARDSLLSRKISCLLTSCVDLGHKQNG